MKLQSAGLTRLSAACLLVLAGSNVAAQQAGASASDTTAGDATAIERNWKIQPTLSLELTHTDNVNLQAVNPKSDYITRFSPGVRIEGKSARASAYVNFQLQRISYLDSNAQDRVQRSLNSAATVELVDDWLYVDLTGVITRQAISAFGAPASGSDSINANVVEATNYQFSPYIKGKLLGNTDYLLRLDNSWYSAKNGPLQSTFVQAVQGSLSGATQLSRLDWGLDANAQQVEYSSSTQKNETQALRGSLTYKFDPQFRVKAIGGQETNDYVNFTKQTTSITGYGFEWAPTERTLLSWTQEDRYFGKGHRLTFTHRTPSTAWRISDSRDVVIQAPQSMLYSRGTYYELLNAQFQSAIPDDAERARYIDSLLQAMNVSPNANVLGGYMTPRATLDRNKEASVVWTGARNVITMSAQSLERTAFGTGIGVPDDFSIYGPLIRQRGVNFNWSYKVTPTASLSFLGNKSRTTGQSSTQDTDRKLYSLILSNKLGAYTTGSIGVRRTEVSGFVSYDENAILGTLMLLF